MRRSGFSLLEVLVASIVLATVMISMAAFQMATLKVNSKEKDRAFATQKAVQIMEEILAYQVTTGTASTENIDSLAQGATEYSFKLTIDPQVTSPTMAISGNLPQNGSYKYVRQIAVEPMPNEKGARRVTVSVFYSNGASTPAAKPGVLPLALVSNIVKAAAIKTQPTQVYDLYLIDIENVPGWWTDPNTLRPILANTIDFLKANNPGLEIRTHWIRRLGYGRDPYYNPINNKAQPADNTTAVPFSWTYFYPGKLTATSMKYNPDVLKGQMRVDGLDQNAVSVGNSVSDLYVNQVPYTYADEFNQTVRYPEEEAKYATAVAAANHKNVPEMSLRMLLEKMASGNLKNAILVNLHAELIPVPPMRNWSDAASVPRLMGQASTITSNWGVTGLVAGDIDEGSHARLVTHPTKVEYATSDLIELRVFPYKSQNHGTEPPLPYREARVILREFENDIADINTGHKSGNSANDIYIDACVAEDSGTKPAGYTYNKGQYGWHRIWPPNDGSYESAYRNIFMDGGSPVVFVNNTDANKDLRKGDMILRFKNLNYTHPLLQSAANANQNVDGLNTAQHLLYGFNYFPDPSLPDLETHSGLSGQAPYEPRNTMRFRIRFKSETARRLDVVTVIGDDENLAHHQYPNRSTTYTWIGKSAPVSERSQIVGDPRLNPYTDVRAAGRYNRYYYDWSAGNAYVNGGANGWNKFPASGTYVGLEIDLPRYFELWRAALQNANGIYLNPAGFSFYYYGMGGEVYSSISGKPYGGSGLTWIDDIIGLTNGIARSDNTWMAVPMLGELYPDNEWDNWSANGNLPAPTYQRKDYASMPKWMPQIGNNRDYNKIMGASGSASFFNGGDTAGNVFSHLFRTGTADLTANGQGVANNFKLYLDSQYESYRPFILNATSYPPDWADSAGTRTDLDWGLLSGALGYYVQSADNTETAVAPIAIKRGGLSGYAVMSSAAPAGASGTTTLARLSLSASLQAFFDLAAPTYRDGTQKLGNAVKLLPRVRVTDPVEDTQLNGNSDMIKWDLNWTRWDDQPYSTQHTSYGANAYRPNLVYNLKFSNDGGTTWKFLDDKNTTAYPGEYDSAHAITGTQWNWNHNNWANKEYLVRLECYRNHNGYLETDYAYHQVAFTIAN